MGKNNEFIGVDDKYIPDSEKYYSSGDDNDAMAGIREDVNTELNNLRGYMSEEQNKKKIKKTVRKTARMAKGIGTMYLIILILVPIFAIGMIIFAVVSYVGFKKGIEEKSETVTATHQEIVSEPTIADVPDIEDAATDMANLQADSDKRMFNSSYEFYSGTQSGNSVSFMLDNLVKDGNNGEHIIEVSYGDISSTDVNDISSISDGFDAFTDYDVTLEYDDAGYVNKIIVTDK